MKLFSEKTLLILIKGVLFLFDNYNKEKEKVMLDVLFSEGSYVISQDEFGIVNKTIAGMRTEDSYYMDYSGTSLLEDKEEGV